MTLDTNPPCARGIGNISSAERERRHKEELFSITEIPDNNKRRHIDIEINYLLAIVSKEKIFTFLGTRFANHMNNKSVGGGQRNRPPCLPSARQSGI